MNNERIARQLVEMAQSLTGKNGMKRNAGGWGRNDADIRQLAKDLQKIGKEAEKDAESQADDEYGDEEDEVDYFWTQDVIITITYRGNSDEGFEDSLEYTIREDGIEMDYSI